jgi:hypothetical protein
LTLAGARTHARRGCVSLSYALVLALILGAGVTMAGDSAPLNISRTPGDSQVPALAVDPQGVIHVVWHDNSAGHFQILYSHSTDGGSTFTRAVAVSGAGEAQVPAITVDRDGGIYVAWEGEAAGNREIFFSRSVDGGATFTSPANLSMSPGDSKHPAIAAHEKGIVYAAWQDSTGPGRQIMFGRSTDGGKTFDAPRPLAPHAVGTRAPTIGVEAAGAVDLVWQGMVKGTPGVVFARSTDRGRMFSEPRLLVPGGRERQAPAVATADGAIYLVWRDRIAEEWEVRFARSLEGGRSFSPPLAVARTPGLANAPAIAAHGRKRIAVAWQDDRTGTPQIFLAGSTDGGVTFSPPANVSGTTGFAHLPALVAGPDRIFLVWHDNSPGNFQILFRVLPATSVP